MRNGNQDNTQNMSIVLYKHQREALDKIVSMGYSNSLSQLVRKIIDQYVFDYVKVIRTFDILTPEQLKIIGE